MFEPKESALAGQHILYDAAHFTKVGIDAFDTDWFDPARLQAHGRVTGWAPGRGRALFFRAGGVDYVLRHYRRGGRVAPILGDRYCWTGLSGNRAWREWWLLKRLREMALPVPQPVAARVERHGVFYRADIITMRIPEARSLASELARNALPDGRWAAIGHTLKRFHTNGVDHADLNAHNILLSPDGVFLIDFDRGSLRRPGTRHGRANLERLNRSLEKINRTVEGGHYDAAAWKALMRGYNEV